MSSINARVPPLRLMAVDTPTDGQIAAYQSSSGQFEWVDDSSGGGPGGSNNEIQYNNSGAFGGDAGFIMDTKGGGGSTKIRVGNLFVGTSAIATATTNGFTYIQSDGTGQIFLQSGSDAGGTFTDTVVNIRKNSASDAAILKFRDGLTQEATIKLDGSGNLDLDNEQNNQNIEMTVKGTGQVEVKQATTNNDSNLLVRGNGTGTPKVTFTNDTKAITVQCDENNKLKVQGALHDFIFDCSSASGGITFPDGTTQTTAATASTNNYDVILPDPTLISSSIYGKIPAGTFLIGTGAGSTQGVSTETYFYPFIANHTGDLASMSINVSGAGASTTQDFGIYNVSNGFPSSLIGKANFDVSTTGIKTQTSLSATISLTKGQMYYLGWSRASGSNFASVQCTDDSTSNGPSFGLGIGSAFGLDSEANQVLYLSSSGALPASVTVTSLLAKNRDFPHIGLLW